MSARNDRHAPGTRSETIAQIFCAKTGQQIPMRSGLWSTLAEVAPFCVGQRAPKRVFLGESGFLKLVFGVEEPSHDG